MYYYFADMRMATDYINIMLGVPLKPDTSPPSVLAEEDVSFSLKTRDSFTFHIDKFETDKLNASKLIKFIIHGWNEGAILNDWYGRLTAALLKEGDYNVIAVDWFIPGTKSYSKSAQNTLAVGKSFISQYCLATLKAVK